MGALDSERWGYPERCKDRYIMISQKKLELNNRIKFTGHIILDEGYGPDNEEYAFIAEKH